MNNKNEYDEKVSKSIEGDYFNIIDNGENTEFYEVLKKSIQTKLHDLLNECNYENQNIKHECVYTTVDCDSCVTYEVDVNLCGSLVYKKDVAKIGEQSAELFYRYVLLMTFGYSIYYVKVVGDPEFSFSLNDDAGNLNIKLRMSIAPTAQHFFYDRGVNSHEK